MYMYKKLRDEVISAHKFLLTVVYNCDWQECCPKQFRDLQCICNVCTCMNVMDLCVRIGECFALIRKLTHFLSEVTPTKLHLYPQWYTSVVCVALNHVANKTMNIRIHS